jgi:hypothetical protein
MIGLCLVLLLGGAKPSVPAEPALDPAEVRLCQAVVVPADALEAVLPEDPDPVEGAPIAKTDAAQGKEVPLCKATVLPTPEPSKEH